ncbi:MAG: SH3 domain-containing C40 family peptidase [Clostridia bacterium]|nr:SH3 domain-containing C40 family peptidase [Clostridia bacterium]
MKKLIISLCAALFTASLLTISAFAANNQGVVIADVLNVRSQPQIADNIVGALYNGQRVDILANDGAWYQINYNSIPAYVHSDYILIRSAELTSRDGNDAEKRGTIGEEVVEFAKQYIGTPYVYGGSSPSGFDCSGFVYYVYKNFGVTLNRVAADQSKNGYVVDRSELMPGDILLFSRTLDGYITHVGIYVGDNQFIHSPQTGKSVEIVSLSSGYYNYGYVGARRIFN